MIIIREILFEILLWVREWEIIAMTANYNKTNTKSQTPNIHRKQRKFKCYGKYTCMEVKQIGLIVKKIKKLIILQRMYKRVSTLTK